MNNNNLANRVCDDTQTKPKKKTPRHVNVFTFLNDYEPLNLYENQFNLNGIGIKDNILKLINKSESMILNNANYHDIYSAAIYNEDIHQQKEEPECVFYNCNLIPVDMDPKSKSTKQQYKFMFQNNQKSQFFVTQENRLQIIPTNSTSERWQYGKYVFSNLKFMIFTMDAPIDIDQSYKIRIEPSCRLTFRLEHWALNKIREFKLIDFLLNPTQSAFLHSKYNDDNNKAIKNNDFNFVEKRILQNPEQKVAVESIVMAKSLSAPFLLIGYPGTGKTQVIVECIHQLLILKNAKILVCAGINFVLDEIAIRLQKSLFSTNQGGNKKLLRYYASSQEDKINNINLIGISNFDVNDKSDTNLKDVIDETDVVLCTFAMAGRIAFSLKQYDDKFTHLFIDEAQSATEPQTLVPIAGLCSKYQQLNTQIILAGDTKQLGPLVKTDLANKLGYGCSMMERMLLNCDIYQPNSHSKLYNSLVICKLVRNYRSHPDILKIPNELFYNNEMISCAKYEVKPSELVNSLRQLQIIPTKFPSSFHYVYGVTQTHHSSLYNQKEINYVYRLLKKLLKTGTYDENEIGIITPYKQQAVKIENLLLNNNLGNVKVGTVKQFIGQEKSVIIVSTVRSDSKNLGFLVDKKRINVLLTRAISMMIFVGNGNTLLQNPLWERIIQNCITNRSVYITNRH